MSSIENLEIIVDIDITRALAALEDLQSELRDLAQHIEAVDATSDVKVRTDMEEITDDLAAMDTQLEAYERTAGITVPVDLRERGVPALPAGTGVGPTRYRSAATMGRGDGGPGIAAKSFRRLTRSIDRARDSFSGFDVRMSDMHNILAALIPVLLVLVGAIPAVVTALIGLAAAAVAAGAGLAALVGFGALGVGMEDGQFEMENLTNVMEDIRDDFLEAFGPLAERLQPLFMDAVDGLEHFFNAVAAQGDALMQLTDEARAFGNFLIDVIPGALRNMAAMAEAFAPVFASIGAFFEDSDILRTFTELTMEALPAIAELTMRILDALPTITRLSIGFLRVVNMIGWFIDVMYGAMSIIGLTDQQTGMLIGGLLTLISAVVLANKVIGLFSAIHLTNAIRAMFAFFYSTIIARQGLIALAVNALANAIVSMYGYITSLVGASSASLSFAAATMIAAGALAAFVTLATLGAGIAIVGMATAAASSFMSMADGIDQATASMQEFDRVQSGAEGSGGFNPYAPDSGTTDRRATSGGGRGGSGATFVFESSGDPEEDRSNAKYAGWREGRTTGGYA